MGLQFPAGVLGVKIGSVGLFLPLQSTVIWFRPGKEKSPVGTWAPAQCLSPSQGHSLQHQITPKQRHLCCCWLSVFLSSCRALETLHWSQINSRLLRTLLHFVGPLDPQGLGIPGQNPVAAHPLGKILCVMMTPAEGNLRLCWVPRFQRP